MPMKYNYITKHRKRVNKKLADSQVSVLSSKQIIKWRNEIEINSNSLYILRICQQLSNKLPVMSMESFHSSTLSLQKIIPILWLLTRTTNLDLMYLNNSTITTIDKSIVVPSTTMISVIQLISLVFFKQKWTQFNLCNPILVALWTHNGKQG